MFFKLKIAKNNAVCLFWNFRSPESVEALKLLISKMSEQQSSMEVDGSNKASQPSTSAAPATQTIMAGAGTAGSVTVSLHPLVIMNVSCEIFTKRVLVKGVRLKRVK